MLNTSGCYFFHLQFVAVYVTLYTGYFISFPKYLYLKSATANENKEEWNTSKISRILW